MGVHRKIRLLGRCMKNQYIGGEFPKKGAWIVCRFMRGPGKKDGVDVFEVGLRPQCTLWVGGAFFLLTQISKANNSNSNYNWHIVSTYLKKNKWDY